MEEHRARIGDDAEIVQSADLTARDVLQQPPQLPSQLSGEFSLALKWCEFLQPFRMMANHATGEPHQRFALPTEQFWDQRQQLVIG